MGWDDLPSDIVQRIWMLRRCAMSRELCIVEKTKHDNDLRIWPLGISPYLREKTRERHAAIRRWCDGVACGHHEWIERWSRAELLWSHRCKVCHSTCHSTDGVWIDAPHPGFYCSRECYMFT